MAKKIFSLFLKVLIWPFWYLQLLIPRDKSLWIFGAWTGDGYADNSRAVFEDVLANEKRIRPIWITRNKEIYKRLRAEEKPVEMTTSLKGVLLNLRAGVVFINNHPKDVNARAINGSLQVYLWHGLMMKQIGRDARNFSKEKQGFREQLKVKLLNFFYPEWVYRADLTINTADFFTSYFCSAFGLEPSQVLLSGYPRNDAIFQDGKEEIIETINKKFKNPLKILYMPTWRDALKETGAHFQPFDSYEFSLPDFLEVLEKKNAVFLNKGHNFENGHLLFQNNAARFINLQNDQFTNLYTLFKGVDILITDYSSVYFDFMLTRKPIILAPFDLKEYTEHSRPFYYDYYEEIEGAKATDWPGVLEIIREESYYPPSDKILKKFHKFQDPNSSRRVTLQVKEKLDLN